jgi:hypothetical protein
VCRPVLSGPTKSNITASYRFRLERDGDRVRLITKGGYNWTRREFGLEGLVSKRSDSQYRGGRSKDWIKVKNRQLTHSIVSNRRSRDVRGDKGTPDACIELSVRRCFSSRPQAIELYCEFSRYPVASQFRCRSLFFNSLDLTGIRKALKSRGKATSLIDANAETTADLRNRAPALVETCGD